LKKVLFIINREEVAMYDSCGQCGNPFERRWFHHRETGKKKMGWRCTKSDCPGAYVEIDGVIFAVPLSRMELAQGELALKEQNYVVR